MVLMELSVLLLLAEIVTEEELPVHVAFSSVHVLEGLVENVIFLLRPAANPMTIFVMVPLLVDTVSAEPFTIFTYAF